MRNYPKHINNREDLDYLIVKYPVETKEFLQGILDSRKIWEASGELVTEAEGITDATHKVVVEDGMEDTKTIYQMVSVDDLGLLKPYEFSTFEELDTYLVA